MILENWKYIEEVYVHIKQGGTNCLKINQAFKLLPANETVGKITKKRKAQAIVNYYELIAVNALDRFIDNQIEKLKQRGEENGKVEEN